MALFKMEKEVRDPLLKNNDKVKKKHYPSTSRREDMIVIEQTSHPVA